MREVEDFSDDRLKCWCIHCGAIIADVPSNRDHVPTKSLLTRELRERGAKYDRGNDDEFGYLPQVTVCRDCNSSFSSDENYFLCVLHAVIAGSLYPDPTAHPEAYRVLRSNRNVVRELKSEPDGQFYLFDNLTPFTIYPDPAKVNRVVVKNARGHAYHELSEVLLHSPEAVWTKPLMLMSIEQRTEFENFGAGPALAGWPEVGSRMTVHLFDETAMVDGWIIVEPGRYRFSVDWSDGITVKSVIWEYLATEVRWSMPS